MEVRVSFYIIFFHQGFAFPDNSRIRRSRIIRHLEVDWSMTWWSLVFYWNWMMWTETLSAEEDAFDEEYSSRAENLADYLWTVYCLVCFLSVLIPVLFLVLIAQFISPLLTARRNVSCHPSPIIINFWFTGNCKQSTKLKNTVSPLTFEVWF